MRQGIWWAAPVLWLFCSKRIPRVDFLWLFYQASKYFIKETLQIIRWLCVFWMSTYLSTWKFHRNRNPQKIWPYFRTNPGELCFGRLQYNFVIFIHTHSKANFKILWSYSLIPRNFCWSTSSCRFKTWNNEESIPLDYLFLNFLLIKLKRKIRRFFIKHTQKINKRLWSRWKNKNKKLFTGKWTLFDNLSKNKTV